MLILALSALTLDSSAPSTDTTCEGFHIPSSYCLPEAPAMSRVSVSREGVHDSDKTRKPWLVLPKDGKVGERLSPKSLRRRMCNVFSPAEMGNCTAVCWSTSLFLIWKGIRRPFISTAIICARGLTAGENSSEQLPLPLRVMVREISPMVLR